jgi:hypothetical protein
MSQISDSLCTSTCGILTNLLIDETNISTIALGGLPHRSPQAIIGGSQGGEAYPFSTIQGYAAAGLYMLNSTNSTYAQNLSISKSSAQQILAPLAGKPPLNLFGSGAELNFRDSIAKGDKTMTPLQFLKAKAADCKVFYLREDLLNMTVTYERIAKGEYVCVDGGMGGKVVDGNDTVAQAMSGTSAMRVEMWLIGVVGLIVMVLGM